MKVTIQKNISLSDFQTLEAQIRDSHVGPKEIQETWESLHEYFLDRSTNEDTQFRWTYFRIYTELTYKLVDTLEIDVFINLFDRQVPMAAILGFDPWKNLMNYLGVHVRDSQQIKSLYSKLQTKFLQSSAFVGIEKGKSVTIKDIVTEIQALGSTQDSLQKAELLARVKNILYPIEEYEKEKFLAIPDDAVNALVGIINFFLGVNSENIYFLVDTFIRPEVYDQTIQRATSVKESLSSESPSIEDLVNTKFPKDENGQYQDIEGVFAYLDTLAEEYNDERIKELFYFDENTGSFVWTKPQDVPGASTTEPDSPQPPSSEHEIPPEFFDEPKHS